MELKVGIAQGWDRKKINVSKEVGIGRLPDAMLCHILSFLKTDDAVRASILSKRWRYAWTFVPCIDFHDIHYYKNGRCFLDFFEKILHLNTVSCLRKLSLTGSIDYKRRFDECISSVMERDIEEIVLDFWGYQCMKLPPTIFTSKNLVILRLGSSIILDVPSSVTLPCLKILHLHLGNYFDDDSMKKLLDGSPVIKELNIQGVAVYNGKTLFVRSSSLKSLTIHSGHSGRLIDVRIVIDVPNVEQLDLMDDGNAEYDINSLSSLVKLNVSIGGSQLVDLLGKFTNTEYVEEIDLYHEGKQCVKLPPSIFTCNKLVILKLCSRIILDVPSSVNLLSLKILHLYLGNSFDEVSMKNIFHGCPVLEELNINIVEDGTCQKRKHVKDVNVQTLFVRSSSLKILSIYCGDNGRLSDLRIALDVPNVERLDLMDEGNVQYDINSLSSLVKLNVNIGQVSRLVELLGKFTNTEYMVMSFETMKILEDQPLDDFPMFHNLTHLELNSHGCRRLVLPALLECMPNLVTLVSQCGRGRFRELPLHHFKAPKCMMLYLEEIELRGFKGFLEEMEMISYFLKNSMVLKKLSINTCYAAGGVRFSEISQELLTFRRSSPECQIYIYIYIKTEAYASVDCHVSLK